MQKKQDWIKRVTESRTDFKVKIYYSVCMIYYSVCIIYYSVCMIYYSVCMIYYSVCIIYYSVCMCGIFSKNNLNFYALCWFLYLVYHCFSLIYD